MGTPSAATPGKKLKLAKDDGKDQPGELVAIKKFKPDKEGEAVTYTGISQSAIREIMVSPLLELERRLVPLTVADTTWPWTTDLLKINREISHEHVTALREVMLEDKSIFLVFEYAEHDFLVRSPPSRHACKNPNFQLHLL